MNTLEVRLLQGTAQLLQSRFVAPPAELTFPQIDRAVRQKVDKKLDALCDEPLIHVSTP